MFTRLIYYGMALFHMTRHEALETPFGLMLDLIECDKQYKGLATPYVEHYIDEIIPSDL